MMGRYEDGRTWVAIEGVMALVGAAGIAVGLTSGGWPFAAVSSALLVIAVSHNRLRGELQQAHAGAD